MYMQPDLVSNNFTLIKELHTTFFYDVDLEINKQKMISDIGKVNSFQRVLT